MPCKRQPWHPQVACLARALEYVDALVVVPHGDFVGRTYQGEARASSKGRLHNNHEHKDRPLPQSKEAPESHPEGPWKPVQSWSHRSVQQCDEPNGYQSLEVAR